MARVHPIRSLCLCAFYLRLHVIARYLRRGKIIILMYHGFTDRDSPDSAENDLGLRVPIKTFKAQIEYLKRFYNIISLERLVDHYTNGAKLPPNPVVITMDDGYGSNYSLAYPVLKEFNAPAVIFLTTDFIDRKEMLWVDRVEYAAGAAKDGIIARLKSMPQESVEETVAAIERDSGRRLSVSGDIPQMYRPLEWGEISEMIRGGLISAGSHTCSHVILTRCGQERQAKEVSLSRQIIEDRTGVACRFFCYPNGQAGDFNNQTKALL